MAGKFIVLSDIHLNLWTYGNPGERLDDQILAIESVLHRAVDENVDAVLWTGDIFHTQGQVHTEILRRLYICLKAYHSLAKITVFLPGNHDMIYRNDSRCHALDFLELFGHVPQMISNQCSPVHLPNMPPIWSCPYTDSENVLKRWLGQFENQDGDLLLMHQGVRGVDFQSKGFVLDEGLAADMIPPGVFHAFVGHCHSLRRISSNMTVPGALQQHHFGDADDPRGYLLVDYDDDGLCMQHFPVGATIFHNVHYHPDLSQLMGRMKEKNIFDISTEFVRIVDVPISRVEEVRAWTRDVMVNDIKIATRSEVQVPMKIQQSEIGDIQSLLERFGRENDLDPKVLEVGREILQRARSGERGAVS